jgi:hypothetical protein
MKKLNLISATLITAGILFAGTNCANAQSKLSFGLNVGAAIPMGTFAKHDSSALPVSSFTGNNAGKVNDTTKLNGFGKTGFHFNVWGQYMIAGPIGVKLMIGGSMISYDVATLNSDIATEYMAYNHSSTGAPTFTSNSYYVGQYLIGPALKLPAGKFNIEGQILVGLVSTTYPTLTENLDQSSISGGVTYSETGTSVVTFKSASGFGYNISAGIEDKIAPLIGLHLDVGYTGSSLSVGSYTQTTSGTETETITGFGTQTQSFNNVQTDNNAKTLSVGLFQITLGVSVDL